MDRHSLSLFLDACSVDGSLHLEAEDPMGAVRRVVCPQPFALIGRHPRADLLLDHAGVSWRHAYLQVVAGRLFFVDLGSPLGIRS
ncbi:MAG: FHA domain-containing protein, partial [Planctomycetia bacterium]|nr:FHA domain-containing protein [Planctomycetia bacterium]